MLLNLNKVNWGTALKNKDFKDENEKVVHTMKEMARLSAEYNKWI
jgi:hypothetical protein